MARTRNKKKQNPTARRSESKQENYEKDKVNSSNSKAPDDKDQVANNDTDERDKNAPNPKGGWRSAGASNDPDWYNADPQLLLDSASFPYAYPLGDPIRLGENGGTLGGFGMNFDNAQSHAIPGVCSLWIKPTIGYSYNKNDAANVCANAFFTHVRVANSGRKNYEAVDLMLYALTIAELYSFIFYCERLYGYMFTYSQRNKYIAKALIEANHVSYDNMLSNLANFRYWLNSFINKVCAWVVPADINIFKRRAFMYANLYLENPNANIKDQLYQFVPDGFMRFQLDENSRGKLAYKNANTWTAEFGHGLWTFEDLRTIANWMLDQITGDEDFALMSGDILKAYGAERIIGLGPMPEEVYVVPAFDPFVLSQFKNATIVSPIVGTYVYETDDTTMEFPTGDICQDNHGNIVCYELLSANCNNITNGRRHKLLSVENPVPGPADSIEASRLLFSISETPSSFKMKVARGNWAKDSVVPLFTSGCDYVTVATISQFREASGVIQLQHHTIGTNTPAMTNITSDFISFMDSEMFKYAPQLFVNTVQTISGVESCAGITALSNIDNYTVLSFNEIQKMHECALLSLFFVPGVAKMVNYM